MRGLRRYRRQTIVVHQANAPSIRGVLLHTYKECVVLGHARSLDDKTDLGGEVVIPLHPGVWWQAHVPEAQ